MPKLNKEKATQADEQKDDWGDFVLLDHGMYIAQLNEVTVETGRNSGNPYWKWEFEVVADEEGEMLPSSTKIWENTSLSEKAIGRIGVIMDAFHVPADTDTDDLIGKYINVTVGQETINGGDRKGELRNKISAYLAPWFPPEQEDEL